MQTQRRRPNKEIPGALQQLQESIAQNVAPERVLELLQRLHDLGLTRVNLQIHLERWRVINEMDGNNEQLENRYLEVLDVLNDDTPSMRIRWAGAAS